MDSNLKVNSTSFYRVKGAQVLLQMVGVFYPADVYVRGNRVYAKFRAGYIGLNKNGTSRPNVQWEQLEGISYTFDPLGKMTTDFEPTEVSDSNFDVAEIVKRVQDIIQHEMPTRRKDG